MAGTKGKWTLWCILLAAAVLRAGLLLAAAPGGPGRLFTPDSHDYDALARSLLDRGEFSRFEDGRAELFRTPGYPIFLAGVYAVSGRCAFAVAGVQIALDVLLCYLTYRLGLLLWSRRVGLLGAAIQAISPAAIVWSVRLLSEQLFTLLLMLALLLLVRFLKPKGNEGKMPSGLAGETPAARCAPWQPLIAGLLIGLGCLVRPAGLPLIPLGAIVLLFGPKRLSSAGLFLAGGLLAVVPWAARNYAQTGYPHISGVADYNLFYCNALTLARQRPDVELTPRQKELADLAAAPGWPPPDKLNDAAFLAESGQEGRAVILHHPWAYGRIHLRTTLNIFLPAATDVLEVLGLTTGNKGTLAVYQQQGLRAAIRNYFGENTWALWLVLPLVLLEAAKILLALAGLAGQFFRPSAAGWLLVLAVLYFVLSPGPVAHARFRVPLEPILSLYAGLSVASFRHRNSGVPRS